MERSFADSKQLHGHRYARLRGLPKVQEQCLLSAACQNMKKIAMHKARKAFLSLLDWFTVVRRRNQSPYRQRPSAPQNYRPILRLA